MGIVKTEDGLTKEIKIGYAEISDNTLPLEERRVCFYRVRMDALSSSEIKTWFETGTMLRAQTEPSDAEETELLDDVAATPEQPEDGVPDLSRRLVAAPEVGSPHRLAADEANPTMTLFCWIVMLILVTACVYYKRYVGKQKQDAMQ